MAGRGATLNPLVWGQTLIGAFGQLVLGAHQEFSGFWKFFLEVWHWTFRAPFRVRSLFQQLEFIGNQSLNILFISSMAVGAVFGLQIGVVFRVFRAENLMGGATGKALCMELAPLVTAILLTGRAGSAMTAEIATMKVNEQIDAMEAMAVHPVSYLVVPRVLAAMLITPLLCALFIFIGMIGAFIAGVVIFNVDQGQFFERLVRLVFPDDLWRGLVKAEFFSLVMAIICCRYGLNARGGAKGVGIATTNSVVVTLLTILGIDVVITYFQVIW